jgi:hypothetical protein
VSWPCGQDSHPSPEATNGATRATRREAGVTGFDCGAVPCFYGRYPTGPVVSSYLIERAEVLALFLRRDPKRGTGRLQSHDAQATGLGGAQARRRQS